MRYVVVKTSTDTIINAVSWDGTSEWVPPDNCIAYQSDLGDIGWKWNDGAPFNPNPLPPPPPNPIDLSNIDNLDRTLKALGLLLRDYTNALQAGTYTTKSVAQLKTDFAAKYNSLL